jgi:hypothetical protein
MIETTDTSLGRTQGRRAGRRQFGSVRRLPSKRWQASYWHLGGRHVADRTFPAKADAQTWLSTVQADIPGRLRRPLARRPGRPAPTTRAKYRHMLDEHVLPVLGGRPITAVTPLRRTRLVHGSARPIQEHRRRRLSNVAGHILHGPHGRAGRPLTVSSQGRWQRSFGRTASRVNGGGHRRRGGHAGAVPAGRDARRLVSAASR